MQTGAQSGARVLSSSPPLDTYRHVNITAKAGVADVLADFSIDHHGAPDGAHVDVPG
jgi:hypothetical protein